MAGIISNVDSDIDKLRKLKNEIESVKKALKGIDIKVNLDIAKGLETQLKSLTKQYDDLAEKIVKTEANITLSVKKINDASEKIIRAQEKISPAPAMHSDPSSAVAKNMTPTNTSEVTSIQAQAKAYDDLRQEIDNILGSRSKNIKRMIEEQSAIRLINQELKEMSKFQGASGAFSSAQQRRLEQLNHSLLTHKTALAEVRQNLANNAKLDNVANSSMNGLSQSLSRMRIAYRELTEEERNSPFGKELLASITQADAKIKALDATIGNHQRNVGDYGRQWNGLNMSIQQVGRELPSLAVGWNTFFLAISNNLPILADELKRAKTEYKALTAQGQKATPVWKQVVSSMFSWQSAITVGITLLTVYGDNLVNWISSLFDAKKAVKSLDDAQEELNKRFTEDVGGIGKQVIKVKTLQEAWTGLGNNLKDKKKFIKDNKEAFQELGVSINNVNDADNLLINNTKAFIEAMTLRAEAEAAYKLAVDEAERSIKAKREADQKKKENPNIWDKLKAFGVNLLVNNMGIQTDATRIHEAEVKSLEDESEAAKAAADSYVKLGISKEEVAKKKLKEAGIKEPEKEDKAEKSKIQAEKKRLQELLNLRRENLQTEIDLMREGTEKKIAQINLDYDNETAAILAKEKEWKDAQGGTLTKEQTVEIRTALINSYVKREKSTSEVNKLQSEEEKRAMNEYLKEYGTYLEKRQAIIDLYNEKIKKATTEGERLSLGEDKKKALSDLDIEANKVTSAISQLFGDMKDKTLKDLDLINKRGQEALEFLKSGEWDEEKGKALGISKETFEIWSKSPDKLKDISDMLGDNKEAADSLRPAYDRMAMGLKKIFSAGDDSKKLLEGFEDLQEGINKAMEAGRFLSDTFTKLGDTVGGTFSGIADGLNVAMDAINSGMQGAQAAASLGLGEIGMAAGAAIGVVSSLASAIAQIHDKKNEKRIERLQDQVDTLNKSYEKLGHSIEKAYSSDASKLIEDQNKLLEQQKVLIQNQIKEEQDKKKTDKGRIKDWQDQIDEINQVIQDNKEKQIDSIFGEDVQSAIDNFAQAYADAWAKGEDKARSSKDFVKNMIKQMIVEAMKADISQPMQQIRDKLNEFWDDKVISSDEESFVNSLIENLSNQLESEYGWVDKYLNENNSQSQSATSGSFQTISQDSADELNGRFAALQLSGEEIRMQNESQTQFLSLLSLRADSLVSIQSEQKDIANESRTIMANSYLELQQIRENTGSIIKPIKEMNDKLTKIQENTKNL